jgi:hypothetical protein
MVGAAITGSAALAAHRVLISEADRDATDKNTIAYCGLSTRAARRLREQWAASLSVQLGATAAQIPIDMACAAMRNHHLSMVLANHRGSLTEG